MRFLIVAFTLLSSLLADNVRSGDFEPSVVVIRASFSPRTAPCIAPDIDPDTDGVGAWYVAAPCQRVSQNPGHPECHQEPEDPCLIFSNGGLLTLDGSCPDEPCQAEYAVDITFAEPCKEPCDQVKCCESGLLLVVDSGVPQGYLASGLTFPFSATSSCPCEETDDNKCIVKLDIMCRDSFGYFYLLTSVGYTYECLRCE